MPFPWWVYVLVFGGGITWLLLEIYLYRTRIKDLEEEFPDEST